MGSTGTDALRDRVKGLAPNGDVSVRSFDEGIVRSLGATPKDRYYFLDVPGVSPAPDFPGIPMIFSFSEDVFTKWRNPIIMVRRDDISMAMNRWHPGSLKYKAPVGNLLDGGSDKHEQQQQSVPFDFTYSLNILARNRGEEKEVPVRNQVNLVLMKVLSIYQPYTAVFVEDSIGDIRSYEAFMEGIASADDAPGIASRTMGFSVTVRVEGELDLTGPEVFNAVTNPIQFNFESA